MKKLFAILLSVLMLCSMIPFAAVSAAGDHYIELVADAEEVDAGGNLAVAVSLYGHEAVGVYGAQVELGFDPAVFELVTTFDEDEWAWMPPIEVGPRFNASSGKYIKFSPIDEETGAMERCLVQYMRSGSTANQAIKTNLYYTVTFKVKDNAPSGDYTIEVVNHNDKNIICYGDTKTVEWTMEPITVTVNGSEPTPPPHTHNYVGTVTTPATCGADGVKTFACECGEGTYTEPIPATGDHTPGADADCVNDQVCTVCGEVLDAAKGHTPGAAADCVNDQVCTVCGEVLAPAAHKFVSEYDYHCADCGYVRELVMSADKIVVSAGKSAKEFNAEKGEGALAFKFDMAVMGIKSAGQEHVVAYDEAYIKIDGVKYELVDIGVVANNKNLSNQTLEDADEKNVLAIKANKAYERKGVYSFAVRITNIPVATHSNAPITMRTYYIYENADGEEITVYGDDVTATYASIAG